MPEVVTANLEKIFFTYILQHPTQFAHVETHFFQNDSIQFVYSIVRDNYIVSKNKYVPTPQQIVTMVRTNDPQQEKVKNEILKALLKNDNSDHEEEYISRRFKAWKMSNKLRDHATITIDELRKLNDIDLDNVKDITSKLQVLYGDLSILEEAEEDLGADFDDADSHKQDVAVNKIPTGWPSLDIIMDGGWDINTLTVFMGETAIGKCTVSSTYIKVKNKITNEIQHIKIGDFYSKIKNKTFK